MRKTRKNASKNSQKCALSASCGRLVSTVAAKIVVPVSINSRPLTCARQIVASWPSFCTHFASPQPLENFVRAKKFVDGGRWVRPTLHRQSAEGTLGDAKTIQHPRFAENLGGGGKFARARKASPAGADDTQTLQSGRPQAQSFPVKTLQNLPKRPLNLPSFV